MQGVVSRSGLRDYGDRIEVQTTDDTLSNLTTNASIKSSRASGVDVTTPCVETLRMDHEQALQPFLQISDFMVNEIPDCWLFRCDSFRVSVNRAGIPDSHRRIARCQAGWPTRFAAVI